MNWEQQFLQLLGILEDMQQKIGQLENENRQLIRAHKQLLEYTKQNQQDYLYAQDNLEYELKDSLEKGDDCFFPEIRSEQETVEEIIKNKKSLARFGDGEFSAIAGRVRHSFQNRQDEALAARLLEVLQTEEEKLLVGIANNYGSLKKYTRQARREIRCYLNPQVRKEHMRLLKPEKTYYDAYVTRPYVMYADNNTDAPRERFCRLQRIWEGRRCIFVEGCHTGLGVGNDLFSGAADIRRVLGPAENAFLCYQEILDFCLKQDKDALFLLALGPAATVLAYDLCRAGFQAVDVGHVDLEYEWYLAGEEVRTQVEGKYNNELGKAQRLERITNPKYLEQVIVDFSGLP